MRNEFQPAVRSDMLGNAMLREYMNNKELRELGGSDCIMCGDE